VKNHHPPLRKTSPVDNINNYRRREAAKESTKLKPRTVIEFILGPNVWPFEAAAEKLIIESTVINECTSYLRTSILIHWNAISFCVLKLLIMKSVITFENNLIKILTRPPPLPPALGIDWRVILK
jgi:hypothetical protein